ncbi:MAG TPA: hypothetical protein VHP32_04845 [Ignavibacteria bacterium]|nr:hypothetical protein [Ignavibacteria bacterium]
MKKLFLLFFVFAFTVPGFAQDKWVWTVAELSYYSGPVSPEYQYRWTVTINNDRSAMFTRTGAGKDTSFSFTLGPKCFNKLNNYIKNYDLITVNPSDMETTSQKIGGPSYTLKITIMNTNPNYDQPPQIKTFPSQQNEAWSSKMNNVYKAMECPVSKRLR